MVRANSPSGSSTDSKKNDSAGANKQNQRRTKSRPVTLDLKAEEIKPEDKTAKDTESEPSKDDSTIRVNPDKPRQEPDKPKQESASKEAAVGSDSKTRSATGIPDTKQKPDEDKASKDASKSKESSSKSNDSGSKSTTPPPPPPPSQAKTSGGGFFKTLFTAIIGGIIALLIAYGLARFGYINVAGPNNTTELTAELDERINQLEEKIDSQDIPTIEQLNAQIQPQITVLEEKLAGLSDVEAANADLEPITSRFEETESQINSLQSKIAAFEEAIASVPAEQQIDAEALKGDVQAQIKAAMDNQKSELQQLTDKIAKTEQQLELLATAGSSSEENTGEILALGSIVSGVKAELTNRVSETDAKFAELSANLTASQEDSAKEISSQLESHKNEVAQELNAVQEEIKTATDQVSSLSDQISTLSTSVSDLEEGLKNLESIQEETSNNNSDTQNSLSEALSNVQSEQASLTQKLNELLSQQSKISDARTVAISLSSSQMERAFNNGSSFQEELSILSQQFPNAPQLEILQQHAATGITPLAKLQSDYSQMLDQVLKAERDTNSDGFFGSILNRAQDVVQVRPVGETTGDTVGDKLARGETRLKEGNLRAAIAEIETITGAAAKPAETWLQQAKTREAVLEAFSTLKLSSGKDQQETGAQTGAQEKGAGQ